MVSRKYAASEASGNRIGLPTKNKETPGDGTHKLFICSESDADPGWSREPGILRLSGGGASAACAAAAAKLEVGSPDCAAKFTKPG